MLSYTITAISKKAAGKRIPLFTWTKSAEGGVREAKRNADQFDRATDLSGYRAELVVDTTKHYRSRDGAKVTIHEVVTHNSVGMEVTFPIKCSQLQPGKRGPGRYTILTFDGRGRAIAGEHDTDIVGLWDENEQEVAA